MTKQIKKDALFAGILSIIAGIAFIVLGICIFLKDKGSLSFDTSLTELSNWETVKPLVIFCLIELVGLINILLGVLSIKYGANIKPETTFKRGLYIVVLVLAIIELLAATTVAFLFQDKLASYLTLKNAVISLVFAVLIIMQIIFSIKLIVTTHKVASKIHN